MLIAVSGTWQNERGPYFAEKALEAIHGQISRRDCLELWFACRQGHVGLFVAGDDEVRQPVRTQLQAAYPEALLTELADDAPDGRPGDRSWTTELWLRHDIYPIRRHSEYADAVDRTFVDPVAIILSALPTGRTGSVRATVRLHLRPCSTTRRWLAQQTIRQLAGSYFCRHPLMRHLFLRWATSEFSPVRIAAVAAGSLVTRQLPSPGDNERLSPVAHLGESLTDAAKDKCGRNLFETRIVITVSAPPKAERSALQMLRQIERTFDAFGTPRLASFGRRRSLPFPRRQRSGFLMSAEELATLWHLPTETARAVRMLLAPHRQLEAPVELPATDQADVTQIGRTNYGRDRRCFGIRLEDRRRHLFVVGKTGMGKSTLLYSMIMADLVRGRGVALF
ncbi:MAG: hypothetical protein KDA89_24665, partial [Planctomycetaceae bacterium]|nr:hypothetical protein [Planctomycetaceae bacterium]